VPGSERDDGWGFLIAGRTEFLVSSIRTLIVRTSSGTSARSCASSVFLFAIVVWSRVMVCRSWHSTGEVPVRSLTRA
jgi:hypothetical protein